MSKAITIDVKGVCGSGKSTLMRLIVEALGDQDIHPVINDTDRGFVFHSRSVNEQERALDALAAKCRQGELHVTVNTISVSRDECAASIQAFTDVALLNEVKRRGLVNVTQVLLQTLKVKE